MRGIRVVVFSMALILACCGGNVIVQESGDASGSGHGDSSGSGGAGGHAGGLNDGRASPPEAGSYACDHSGTCTLCNDEKWHCSGNPEFILPSCPVNVVQGALCKEVGGFSCFNGCSNGLGQKAICSSGRWAISPGLMTCSPSM
jgi:hypothetical protein